MRSRIARNEVPDNVLPQLSHTLSVFHTKGQPFGGNRNNTRCLNGKELNAAHLHVLLNCEEVQPYVDSFKHDFLEGNSDAIEEDVDARIQSHFSEWFKLEVMKHREFNDKKHSYLVQMSQGPSLRAESYNGYKVDGVKFLTETRNQGKLTYNCGVCVKGSSEGEVVDNDYYGILQEVIRIEYAGEPIKRCVLFKCHWFNPVIDVGLRYPKLCPFAEIDSKRKYAKGDDDPFIFADSATQVVYLNYPRGVPGKRHWLVAIPNKHRGSLNGEGLPLPYQEDQMSGVVVDDVDNPYSLVDESSLGEEVNDDMNNDNYELNGDNDQEENEEDGEGDEEGEWEDDEDTDEDQMAFGHCDEGGDANDIYDSDDLC